MQALADRLASAPSRPWPTAPVPIALVITDLDVGGAERALVALAARLDRTRFAPHVIALSGEGMLAQPLRDAGIPTHCLGIDKRRPLSAWAKLARTLRPIRPRLIQSFLFHANVLTRLAAPWVDRPWILGGIRVAEREQGWHRTLERRTGRLGCGWVCVSEGVARFSREVGRLDPRRLTVIPNGIDVAPFHAAQPLPRHEFGIPEGVPLALFVGRIAPQKDLPTLLAAARLVLGARPDWHLAIVGDGPDRPALMADSPDLDDRVHWLGRRDDVPRLLKTADLFVLSSRWEGMPNAVLEAMAAGRAVAATAVEGTEDLVIPGRTGWLVPPGDPKALALALIEAASDPERLKAFGAAGRARVERDFRIEAVVSTYEQLWSRVLGYAASDVSS